MSVLTDSEWLKLSSLQKLTLEEWEDIPQQTKLSLIKLSGIDLGDIPYGNNYNSIYPDDIYLYEEKNKYVLNTFNIDRIASMLTNYKEYGGVIDYYPEQVIRILGTGDSHNVEYDTGDYEKTLFHTHPANHDYYEPVSSVDIATYITTVSRYFLDLLVMLESNKPGPKTELLPVQNEMVFAREGIYVYYISYPLILDIMKQLGKVLDQTKDEEKVHDYIDRVELIYISYIKKLQDNYIDNMTKVDKYLDSLRSIGIIINLYPYNTDVESYIL